MRRPSSTPTSIVALGLCSVLLQLGGLTAAAAAHLEAAGARHGTPAQSSTESSIEHRDSASTTVPTTPAPPPPPTTAPPPVTTAAPPPAAVASPPAARTVSAPAPTPAPDRPSPSPEQRVRAAFEAAVPAPWRAAIPVRLEIIEGSTSWAHADGLIQVGWYHATGSDARLHATIAHEFGHLIAFRHGSRAYNGAGPEGWPAYGSNPAEAWADCVSQAFTGIVDPSHGLPPCQGESLAWTRAWLADGPPAAA